MTALTSLTFLLLLTGGVVMLSEYHHDDIHTNANGFISNISKCRMDCTKGSPIAGDVCVPVGTVQFTYQMNDDLGTWYQEIFATPSFCFEDCCLNYLNRSIPIYFVIKDQEINVVSLVPDYNLHILLSSGIISLIIALSCAGLAVLGLRSGGYDRL